MKKTISLVLTLAVMFMASLAFAGSAAATPQANWDAKKQTICHYNNGQGGQYNKINVDANSIIRVYRDGSYTETGHGDDANDIIPAFNYVYSDADGEPQTGSYPGKGDQSLLEFEDCEKPRDPEKVTPTVSVVDECGTKNDSVQVSEGTGFTRSVTKDGLEYTVYVEAVQGFILDLDNSWTVSDDGQRGTKVYTLTNEDCDLPETGSAATFATGLGILALFGAGVVLIGMALTGRKNN